MKKDEIKEVFHSLFNKINNICIIAASNVKDFQQKNLDKASREELQADVSQLVDAFAKTEENARKLNSALEELYRVLS